MLEPFSNVMQKWLYDRFYGYYKIDNIGSGGDFYTSVSLSKFFGASIARYIIRLLEEEKLTLPLNIIEIGANNGNLISDIAEFLSAFSSEVFANSSFATLEHVDSMIATQRATFEERIKTRFHKEIFTFSNISDINVKENIFFISNEIFDSMPCDLIIKDSMLYFDDGFVWGKISDEVMDFKERFKANGAEISLSWESFIRQLCLLDKWVFLTFDYGDFIARDMNLRMFYKHKVYNFYEELDSGRILDFFTKSDITYDVDFSVLRNIFKSYGTEEIFCLTQSKCLIEECFILEVFEIFSKNFSDKIKIKQTANLNGLINPAAMGDVFKALCVSHNIA